MAYDSNSPRVEFQEVLTSKFLTSYHLSQIHPLLRDGGLSYPTNLPTGEPLAILARWTPPDNITPILNQNQRDNKCSLLQLDWDENGVMKPVVHPPSRHSSGSMPTVRVYFDNTFRDLNSIRTTEIFCCIDRRHWEYGPMRVDYIHGHTLEVFKPQFVARYWETQSGGLVRYNPTFVKEAKSVTLYNMRVPTEEQLAFLDVGK
jgi:hypothetical protein